MTGQVGLGLLVGITMWLSPDIVMSENFTRETVAEVQQASGQKVSPESEEILTEVVVSKDEIKSPQTTIPFVKNNNFNYQWLTSWLPDENSAHTLGWILFVFVVVIVVTAVSNGANLTDGIDGLCAGTSAIIGIALLIMAYLGGNVIYSVPEHHVYTGSEELVVFAAAFIGALVGFLWYNAYRRRYSWATRLADSRRHSGGVRYPYPQGTADSAALPHLLP